MNAIFCHNNVFVTDEKGQVLSEPQFGSEAWSRYLEVFEHLTVVGRNRSLQPGEGADRFDVSGREGVDFRFLPNLSGPLLMLANRRKTRTELESMFRSTDAVIVRGSGEIAQLSAQVAYRMKKPVAVEVVGCAFELLWNYGTWQGKIFAPFSYLRMRRTLARAAFAIYVSESFLPRRYPCAGRTAVASNVEIPEPAGEVLDRRLRRIYSQPRPVSLGLIGSLIHGHKGVGVALKALAHVRDEIPEIQLKILGNGDPTPWRRLASRLGVEDITRFCGTIPSGEHVLRWLDDIDLYIQPSLTEGLPRAVIEAMSRGCPVLASSAGGTSELLDDDALHRPGDVDRFSDQITSLLRYVPRQTEMARDNFEMSRRYSTDVLSAKRRAFWSAFGAYAAMMKDGSNKLLWQENEGR